MKVRILYLIIVLSLLLSFGVAPAYADPGAIDEVTTEEQSGGSGKKVCIQYYYSGGELVAYQATRLAVNWSSGTEITSFANLSGENKPVYNVLKPGWSWGNKEWEQWFDHRKDLLDLYGPHALYPGYSSLRETASLYYNGQFVTRGHTRANAIDGSPHNMNCWFSHSQNIPVTWGRTSCYKEFYDQSGALVAWQKAKITATWNVNTGNVTFDYSNGTYWAKPGEWHWGDIRQVDFPFPGGVSVLYQGDLYKNTSGYPVLDNTWSRANAWAGTPHTWSCTYGGG